LNPRPRGYEQADRHPRSLSLHRISHLASAEAAAASPPVPLCAVPSHAVLVTAMVMRPGHRPRETPKLVWLMRVDQSRIGRDGPAVGSHVSV
jgi:hypothetical protein